MKNIIKLSEKCFKLNLIETHNNQYVFNSSSNDSKYKLRARYRNDGFISLTHYVGEIQ